MAKFVSSSVETSEYSKLLHYEIVF